MQIKLYNNVIIGIQNLELVKYSRMWCFTKIWKRNYKNSCCCCFYLFFIFYIPAIQYGIAIWTYFQFCYLSREGLIPLASHEYASSMCLEAWLNRSSLLGRWVPLKMFLPCSILYS